MFKFPIAAVVGFAAALSATAHTAHADTIIYQGTPTHEPLIISRGDAAPLSPLSHSILQDPAFHRLAAMCETLGMACGPEELTHTGGIDPVWTPAHRDDAEKRLAQMIEDREAYAEALEEHFDALPAPRLPVLPHLNFGWNTPLGAPFIARPAPTVPDHFLNRLPSRPSVTLPRAHGPDLSGFYHRLNNPAVIPHGILPRPSFPWRAF